uniref:Uncharacterized protein n=1 Tax=Astyanax mexicanus TaxID=7994 RepID=A0A3B1ISE5_ASTMX
IGTFGQCRRKVKMASRLTMAHSMQNRMMPRKVPPPPAAGEPQTLAWPRSAENLQGVHMNKK